MVSDCARCSSNDVQVIFFSTRSRVVSAQVVHQAVGSDKVQRFQTAAALMSNHSLEAEEDTYAGEANVGGVEGIQRKDFKKLSKAFNERVFGAEDKGKCILHLTPQTSQPSPPLPSGSPSVVPAGEDQGFMADRDEKGDMVYGAEGTGRCIVHLTPHSSHLTTPPITQQLKTVCQPTDATFTSWAATCNVLARLRPFSMQKAISTRREFIKTSKQALCFWLYAQARARPS
jgi:hypothetical protein